MPVKQWSKKQKRSYLDSVKSFCLWGKARMGYAVVEKFLKCSTTADQGSLIRFTQYSGARPHAGATLIHIQTGGCGDWIQDPCVRHRNAIVPRAPSCGALIIEQLYCTIRVELALASTGFLVSNWRRYQPVYFCVAPVQPNKNKKNKNAETLFFFFLFAGYYPKLLLLLCSLWMVPNFINIVKVKLIFFFFLIGGRYLTFQYSGPSSMFHNRCLKKSDESKQD